MRTCEPLMVRFLHTGDLQLGMTRHFLSEEAQARFAQARFDSIRSIGRIAGAEGCAFVIVSGDVFESNQVDRRTVARALEALATVPVPVLLLPGNHDPLDQASVFRSPTFLAGRPSHVHVLDGDQPVSAGAGVEVLGAPWTSKRPVEDLAARAYGSVAPAHGTIRILVAHGAVDALAPDRENPALISLAGAETALREGRIHYCALGDRHSLTPVGTTGRIAYAGTPEPTDFDEEAPGNVLVVEVTQEEIATKAVHVGTWRFERRRFDLAGDTDLDALARTFADDPDKERLVLKLDLVGTLTLRQKARLDETLGAAQDRYGSIVFSRSGSDLAIVPDDEDFSGLELSGFAAAAVETLRREAASTGPGASEARDALALLVRLAGERT